MNDRERYYEWCKYCDDCNAMGLEPIEPPMWPIPLHYHLGWWIKKKLRLFRERFWKHQADDHQESLLRDDGLYVVQPDKTLKFFPDNPEREK